MSYKVLTDGNGSGVIHVVGLGYFMPLSDHQAMVAECEHKSKEIADIMAERDALAAQVGRLQSQLNEEDKACEQAIDQRDYYHERADELANAIARFFGVDIGEHSSANCPWSEAIYSIPQQCLAEIRAEAGRAGFVACADHFGLQHAIATDAGIKRNADAYAEQIRQGGTK